MKLLLSILAGCCVFCSSVMSAEDEEGVFYTDVNINDAFGISFGTSVSRGKLKNRNPELKPEGFYSAIFTPVTPLTAMAGRKRETIGNYEVYMLTKSLIAYKVEVYIDGSSMSLAGTPQVTDKLFQEIVSLYRKKYGPFKLKTDAMGNYSVKIISRKNSLRTIEIKAHCRNEIWQFIAIEYYCKDIEEKHSSRE